MFYFLLLCFFFLSAVVFLLVSHYVRAISFVVFLLCPPFLVFFVGRCVRSCVPSHFPFVGRWLPAKKTDRMFDANTFGFAVVEEMFNLHVLRSMVSLEFVLFL